MTQVSLRTAGAAGALAVLIAVALTACGPSIVGPATPSPTPEPSMTPEPTVAPAIERPQARLDTTCADLADLAIVQNALADPVDARDALAAQLGGSSGIPNVVYVEALGGLGCLWSNGVSRFDESGTSPDFIAAEVAIIPNDNDQWGRYRDTYAIVDDREAYCYTGSQLVCIFNSLVNGFWIEATLTGVREDPGLDSSSQALRSAAGTLFDDIAASVAAAPAPAVRAALPSDTLLLPATCDAFIPVADVQAVLGISDTLIALRPGGGWSLWAAAVDETSDFGCSWSVDEATSGAGTIEWLPGGEWAATDALAVATTPSTAAPVTIAGLTADDSAFIRCLPGDEACTIDIIIGHSWIQVATLRERSDTPPFSIDRRAGAIAIATEVVANLRP